MSVFDIDAKEGKSKDNAHWGSNTEDGVDGGIDSGLLNPLVSSVFRRFRPVAWPADGLASLHVESSGDPGVLPHTDLLLAWSQEVGQTSETGSVFSTNYLINLNISQSAVILESDRTLQK